MVRQVLAIANTLFFLVRLNVTDLDPEKTTIYDQAQSYQIELSQKRPVTVCIRNTSS